MIVGAIIVFIGMLIASSYLPFASAVPNCGPNGTLCTTTTNTTSGTSSTTTTATEPSVSASSSETQSSATTTITTTCAISSCSSSTTQTTTTVPSTGQVQLEVTVLECSNALSNSCFPVPYPQIVIQHNGLNLYSCAGDVNGYCDLAVAANIGSVNICYAAGATLLACDYSVNIGSTSPVVQGVNYYTTGFSVIRESVYGISCDPSQCTGLVYGVNAIIGIVVIAVGLLVIAYSVRKK